MIIVVTGTRRANILDHGDLIRDVILGTAGDDTEHTIHVSNGHTIRVGDAHGVDWIVRRLFRGRLGWHLYEYVADWRTCVPECPPGHRRRHAGSIDTYCPLAGHRRNDRMVQDGGDCLLAFPAKPPIKSNGTHDCVDRARKAGLSVQITELNIAGCEAVNS